MHKISNIVNSFPFWIFAMVVGFLSALVYLPLVNGFFIQDEWQLFSIFYGYTNKPFLQVILSFLIPEPGQYVPITQTLSYTSFQIFNMNYLGYFFIGIMLHVIAGILLGFLILKVSSHKWLALFAESLFILAPQHFQGTTWVIANFGYSFAAIFFILGLINFFNWLDKNKMKYVFLSVIFFFLSVISKEITAFIILGLPLLVLIWSPQIKKIITVIFIVSPVFLFVFFHYLYIKANPLADYSINNSTNIYNIIFLPVRSLAQSFLPQEMIYRFSKILIMPFALKSNIFPMTSQFDQLVQGIGAQIVVSLVLIVVIVVGWVFYQLSKKNKDLKYYFKLYLTGIVLASLSGLPYIFVDTTQFSLLQSRYTYIGVICIIFSLIAMCLFLQKYLGNKIWPILLIVLLYFGISTLSLSNNLSKLGETRKSILKRLDLIIPSGQKNVVLFVESDSSFFGLPSDTKIVPFQNGFGKTAGIYLYNKIYLPTVFYSPDILWPIESQGFISDKNGSFGYFREYSKLEENVRKNNIPVSHIYSFIYRDRTKLLLNQTEAIRIQLNK